LYNGTTHQQLSPDPAKQKPSTTEVQGIGAPIECGRIIYIFRVLLALSHGSCMLLPPTVIDADDDMQDKCKSKQPQEKES
jgi:hypothetical protein